jgi:hypothetical protein
VDSILAKYNLLLLALLMLLLCFLLALLLLLLMWPAPALWDYGQASMPRN